MTYTDLQGQEFDHPEKGRLSVIEHNHIGQVFCYDVKGHYHIIEADDPSLDGLEVVYADEVEIEFAELGEELIADPESVGILILITEAGDLNVKAKNLMPEDAKEIIRTLDDIFSEPYEGRYIAN